MQAIESVNRREAGSQLTLVGLLGMLYRFSQVPTFQEQFQAPIEACMLNFCYWKDEPDPGALDFSTESDAILFHTAEILAGQRYPESTFTNNGKIGRVAPCPRRAAGPGLAAETRHERVSVNGIHPPPSSATWLPWHISPPWRRMIW